MLLLFLLQSGHLGHFSPLNPVSAPNFPAPASIFHTLTGRWPTTHADDLAPTLRPLKCPYRRFVIQNGNVVAVWRDNLPDPKQNAGVVLTYYNPGLSSALGRKWVCWGDLRTDGGDRYRHQQSKKGRSI